MFAALPAKGRVTSERTLACRELVAQWQFLLARSSQLGKCFISVKGVYFQAEIQGVPVTWINPHEFTQTMPTDVDYRTMLTFLEFYETLLKFALFKLYLGSGLRYPPPPAAEGDEDYLKRGRLLAINAQALDASQGDDSDDDDDEAGSGLGEDAAKAQKAAKDAAEAKAAAKAAAKRANKLRKKLATSAGAAAAEDEEDEEDEAGEDGGAGGDGEESTRLQPSLSRAEVNRQLEAALVEATGAGGMARAAADGGDDDARPPLFAGLVFFLSRESQYSWLEFAILAFGGRVGWAGSGEAGSPEDPAVTHVVYDRPTAPQRTRADVEYVQPQWVIDSLNVKLLLPVERYAPGATLPPHLSPFVDDAKEGYVPQYRTELQQLKSAAEEYGNSGPGAGAADGAAEVEAGGAADDASEEEDEDASEEDEEEEDDGEEGEEDEESEEGKNDGEENEDVPVRSEEKELALSMMSKKARRLYDRMQYGIAAKSGKVESLKRKAAATGPSAAAAPAATASATGKRNKGKGKK